MKLINTLCGQNSFLFDIKAGGTYSYHWALKGHANEQQELNPTFINGKQNNLRGTLNELI
jgi:hypothetical protein